ncbi:MAG: Zn-dependent hydrolase [Gemmatimonadetes bacterium]|nr:Zn-dependent hydrolase [Gemmatimonadota bacterium]
MNRREFASRMSAAVGAAAMSGFGVSARQEAQPRVNGPRAIEQLRRLAQFGGTPEGGTSRVAYSDADLAARDHVMGLMRAASLDTAVDGAGNIVGRRAGRDASLAPLMFGSHIDSVPDGGNYDGQVGSIGAIEVAHTLADHAIVTRHPLEVVVFQNEEGGKTGSRLLSGEVAPQELDIVTHSGFSIGEGMRRLGGNPDDLESLRRHAGDIAAYLELHIEQGAVLEREGIAIGVVEGIVGIKRWDVTIDGFANHAGTTPMDQRRDAMLGAGRFIDAVHRTARRIPGRQVATVGRLQALPGAPNVIPGRVVLSLEIRDLAMEKIATVYEAIREEGLAIGEETGTTFAFDQFYVSRAAPTDERLRRLVADAAADLGLTFMRMPSGAGHDAQSIALLAPVGMIFVPSRSGISHSPQEFSHPDDIVAGMDVLLHTLLALDAMDFG